ncbi:hypothetical protein VNO77_04576 [Canavalia gladiata]|uniref:Uncharacterized protein n=1 Tax=Canavalia gladiata TaxID=3824 RepID=A0AAN9R7W8_CANGL
MMEVVKSWFRRFLEQRLVDVDQPILDYIINVADDDFDLDRRCAARCLTSLGSMIWGRRSQQYEIIIVSVGEVVVLCLEQGQPILQEENGSIKKELRRMTGISYDKNDIQSFSLKQYLNVSEIEVRKPFWLSKRFGFHVTDISANGQAVWRTAL